MKTFLRLLGKIPIRRKLSAVSNQPSEKGSQQSVVSYQHLVLGSGLSAKSGLTPKTYTLIPFLILVFVSCSAALAQESAVHATPAVQAEATTSKTTDTEITPLKIGDKIPDELWEMYFPVVSAKSDQVQYLSLGDFKDKLIILDFWATWCAPCISSLHKLDTLQEQFKDDLMVIPTSYEPESKIKSLLSNRNINLQSLIEEKEMKKYFPHKSVPHQVWIKDNIVRAIVKQEDTSVKNIKKILKSNEFTLETKRDILDYDAFSNILIYAKRTETPILSTSSFTSRIEGLPASTGIRSVGGLTVVNYTNVNPLLMYSKAIGAKNNQIIVKGENLKRIENVYGETRNRYCYQLITSNEIEDKILKKRILSDLNSQFDLKVDSQIMEVDCYVISNSLQNNEASLKVLPETNLRDNGWVLYDFPDLVNLLNFSVKWTPDQPIFIDQSNYKGKVETEQYEILQKDVNQLKQALIPFGLTVIKEKHAIKMFVISDADINDSAN